MLCAFLATSCESDPEELTPPVKLVAGSILYDQFQDHQLIIYHNSQFDVMVAYDRTFNGQVLEFQESDSLPAILEDNLGNYWDVFGKAVKGPNQGAQLDFVHQVKAYWFSVAAFYPEVSLYSEGVEKSRLEDTEKDGWLIDTDFVVQAALPNAIPAIYDPPFKQIKTKELFIEGNHKENDLILAVRINGEERIYPERVLEYHEIVNDNFQSTSIVLSFCPLTGTGFCWDSGNRSYYVSGFLHNANLILTDWESGSQWSQIYGKSIFGSLKGEELEQLQVIELNWEGRALLSGNITLDTGQELPAGSPYQSYKVSPSIGYPISYEDSRVPTKEKVLAIILNDKAKVYRASDF
ncbi:MAG: hypothetical protein DHS20C17_15130 [Cyclobacteriaceae bacterium]|nr:MAG: hypothetical protein DHS20C17_15130 [Cyclobacteriaceae bacterium]